MLLREIGFERVAAASTRFVGAAPAPIRYNPRRCQSSVDRSARFIV
jgi:hypothetical protein